MTSKRHEKRELVLEQVRVDIESELDWLNTFIRSHHSVPDWVIPSREDLRHSKYVHFRARVVLPSEHAGDIVGVTGYEIKTPYLVETARTILAPEARGKGWGKLLSHAVEEAVKAAGFGKIKSSIYASNHAMIAIKMAQGYVIEGFHPDHDGPGLHEYTLGKRLKD